MHEPSALPFWSKPQIGRRLFFRHIASAMTGYWLLPGRPMETVARAAVSPQGTAKNCIFILMQGAIKKRLPGIHTGEIAFCLVVQDKPFCP